MLENSLEGTTHNFLDAMFKNPTDGSVTHFTCPQKDIYSAEVNNILAKEDEGAEKKKQAMLERDATAQMIAPNLRMYAYCLAFDLTLF